MDEFKDPERITEQMKGGLARMYADSDFREYLIHAINIQNQNVLTSLKNNKPDEAKDYAVKLDTLKQLLEKGKSIYNKAEQLRSKPLEEQLEKYGN